MRRLSMLLILLVLLPGALWLGGESLMVRELRRASAQDSGLQIASVAPLRDPRRLGASMTDVQLRGERLGLSLPQATLWIAPLRPTQARLALPPRAMLDLDGRSLPLGLDDATARLRLRPMAGLTLGGAQLASGPVTVGGASLVRSVRADAVAVAPGDDAPALAGAAYDLDFRLAALDPRLLAPDLRLPGLLDVTGKGRIWLDAAPGPTRLAADTRPVLVGLRIDQSELALGRLRLRASGWLQPDAQGRVEGQIALYSPDARQLLEVAASVGLIPRGVVSFAGNMMESISSMPLVAGRMAFREPARGELRLPLIFAGGRVSLGPLPLGAAPQFPR